MYQATICFGNSGCGPKISVPCFPSLNPENLLRGLPDMARIHRINAGASSSYWSSAAAAAKIGSHAPR